MAFVEWFKRHEAALYREFAQRRDHYQHCENFAQYIAEVYAGVITYEPGQFPIDPVYRQR